MHKTFLLCLHLLFSQTCNVCVALTLIVIFHTGLPMLDLDSLIAVDDAVDLMVRMDRFDPDYAT